MLLRSLLRTIRSTFGRFLAIFAIIALGVGFFIGLRVTHDSMLKTADDYLTDLLLYDFRLVSTLGLTEEDVKAFQKDPGILLAEGSFSADALIETKDGSDDVLHFHTLLPDVNRVDLVNGRLPQADDEVVLDARYAGPGQVGKVITLAQTNDEETTDHFTHRTYRVVGTANTSYYVNFERGSTSLGSGKVSGFAYVLPEAFTEDYYTEIFLRLADMPAMGTQAYTKAAETRQKDLEDLLEQRGDIRYESLKEEANDKIAEAQAEIDDGWAKIADGKADIADAETKLADADRELRDARKELDDGWAELADAEAELADAKQELDDGWAELVDARKELDDARIELADARKELDDGWAEYQDGLTEYEDGKKEYEDGLAKYESGLSDYRSGRQEANEQLAAASQQLDTAAEQLSQTRRQLDEAAAQKDTLEQSLPYMAEEEQAAASAAIETMAAQIAYGEAAYAQGLSELEAGREAYEAAEATAKGQLRSARRKLDDAKKELDEAKQKLDDAEKELSDALTELEDGEKEYADGLAEYEDGEKEYADGLAEYEDGKKEYEDGLKKYEDAKAELEEGEKEYADGLAEYRTKSAEAEETIRNAKADIAQAEIDLTEGQQKVDDARQDLADLKEPTVYVLGRDKNAGYAALENDTAIVEGIAKIFPLFFFLIAVLVCITTMTRMVDEQRTENGTLKALGYSDFAIISRYLIYSGSASILGCFTGFFAGSKFMPITIWKIYRIMYDIDRPVAFVLDWKVFWICTGLYLLCSLGSTWFVAHSELKEMAAELIRPKAPEAGKRVLLERIPLIWKRFSFLRKVSIRNIFLYKKRMVMMIIGIGGCTALLLTGFGIRDTISGIVDYQYEEISLYDADVTFAEALSEAEESAFLNEHRDVVEDAVFLSVKKMDVTGKGTEEANIVAFSRPPEGFVDLHREDESISWPGEGEAVLNNRLARDLGLAAGDTITIVDDDLQKIELKVTGVFDNYLFDYVYVAEENFVKEWGTVPERKNAYVTFRDSVDVHQAAANLLSSDDVLAVSLAADLRSTIGSLLESMDYVVLIVLVCSGALAFIVLYNLTNISITERRREIATLKVLGFFQNETAQYVFRENIILTGISALFGIPMGMALLRYVMAQIVIKQMYFGCRLAPVSYVHSVLITFAFAVLIDLVLRVKIENIDMAESMKAIE